VSLDTGRKDSLSLNVEFVKVNISRSRKGFVPTDILSTTTSTSFSGSSGGGAGKLTNVDSQTAANIVRFSGKYYYYYYYSAMHSGSRVDDAQLYSIKKKM